MGSALQDAQAVDDLGQRADHGIYNSAVCLLVATANVAGDKRQHELHFGISGGWRDLWYLPCAGLVTEACIRVLLYINLASSFVHWLLVSIFVVDVQRFNNKIF